MTGRQETQAKETIKQLQLLGNKALIINILFFVVLFVGILLVPLIGFLHSVIIVGIAFMGCILYLNEKNKKKN